MSDKKPRRRARSALIYSCVLLLLTGGGIAASLSMRHSPADPAPSASGTTASTEDGALTHIGVPQAWAAGATGNGVTIAVIDSGVVEIPALGSSVLQSQSRSFVDGENLHQDPGHGTEMASIIHRVAPDAKLLVLKALNEKGSGSQTIVAAAINYAVEAKVNVINLSLEGGADDATLESSIANAIRHDVLVVIAAGNEGLNLDRYPRYPAAYSPDHTVVTAASASTDELAGSSNYGQTIAALAAPGVDVLATSPTSEDESVSGTSPAAALTSGAAALVLSVHPAWSADQVRSKLLSSATPAKLTTSTQSGGELNVEDAVH